MPTSVVNTPAGGHKLPVPFEPISHQPERADAERPNGTARQLHPPPRAELRDRMVHFNAALLEQTEQAPPVPGDEDAR
jgi:hypothetical protein